jgi:hypothetical protein
MNLKNTAQIIFYVVHNGLVRAVEESTDRALATGAMRLPPPDKPAGRKR